MTTGRPAVLVVHPSDELYGADRILLRVLDAISGLVEPVVVLPADVMPGALSAALHERGIRVERVPLPILRRRYSSPLGIILTAGRGVVGLVSLWRIGRRERVAVVHSNTAAVLIGPFVATLLRVPHVWHIHEILERPRWLGRAVARATRLHTARVVAISGAVRKRLEADGGRVSDVFLNPAPSWDASPPAGDPPTVLMIGRANGWKGHEVFMSAAELLHAGHPEARFRMVGGAVPGRPEPYEAMLAQAYSIDPDQKWLEVVGHVDEARSELERASIVVLPSTGPEPLNITALEAMALGRPVIASNVGGLPEVVDDGVTGKLVEPGDPKALAAAIACLLDDPVSCTRFAAAGRARVNQLFRADDYAAEWTSLYRDLLGIEQSGQSLQTDRYSAE
jgi:glycosyltransferase involved in cell wall biosynthesis